ncbi:hypothetical protein VTO73DRAFT_12968 [Trametes versicolor]
MTLRATHMLYSAQNETIITLTSPPIKFEHKTSNARREAVRKANRSSFKQIHDLQDVTTFLPVTEGAPEPAKLPGIYVQGAAGAVPPVLVGKGITFDSEEISGGDRHAPNAREYGRCCYRMLVRAGDRSASGAVYTRFFLRLSTRSCLCYQYQPIYAHPGHGEHVASCGGPSRRHVNRIHGAGTRHETYIVYAMNHEPIQIDNTDGEGRLVLYDAMHHESTEFEPKTYCCRDIHCSMVYDIIITMTSRAALLQVLDSLQDELHATDLREHYRFWRMPVDEGYDPQVYGQNAGPLNTGGTR